MYLLVPTLMKLVMMGCVVLSVRLWYLNGNNGQLLMNFCELLHRWYVV